MTTGGEHWRPAADLRRLRERAGVLAAIRAFFAARDVLEVETPIVSRATITDPNLPSLRAAPADGSVRYLHTSPEFPMKRLLAAGSGCIYQIARVFRDGERGQRHNPEFTLLEWYRVGFDHHRLMDEVDALVTGLAAGRRRLAASERVAYRTLFREGAGVDPFETTVPALAAACERLGLAVPPGMPAEDIDPWLDLILALRLERELGRGRLSFLHSYPPSQAALARVSDDTPAVACRFELYLDGLELANGFYELGDAGEQARRFAAENARRLALGRPQMPVDGFLLDALAHGLPDCAGVALGVDRLLIALYEAAHIDAVMAFPWERV